MIPGRVLSGVGLGRQVPLHRTRGARLIAGRLMMMVDIKSNTQDNLPLYTVNNAPGSGKVPFGLILLALFFFLLVGPVQAGQWIMYDEPEPTHYVIRDQESFDRFRRMIPEEVPSKKRPAPDNDDPWLKQRPDFSKEMLVVVARGGTISSHPKLVRQEELKDGVKLVVELPEPPPEARPYGWGVYLAVRLPASTGKVTVEYR